MGNSWRTSTCDDHNPWSDHSPWSVPQTVSVTCVDFLNHNFGGGQNLCHAPDHVHDHDHGTYHDLCSYDHGPFPAHGYLLDPCLLPCHGPGFVPLIYKMKDKK